MGLSPRELDEALEHAVAARLYDHFDALVVRLGPEVAASLPNTGKSGQARLDLDLRTVNGMDAGAHGELPLATWLRWAAQYAPPGKHRRFFDGLLRRHAPAEMQSSVAEEDAPGRSPMLPTPSRVALFVTALPLEFGAVVAHLGDRREQEGPDGTIYEAGAFVGPSGAWRVVVLETGAGNLQAATRVQRAADQWRPEVVIMVGVAGGVKDVGLGDVVVADKVYWIESGKETDDGLRPRPVVLESSHRALERARGNCRSDEWKRRVVGSTPPAGLSARIGPIAADEKVVASDKSATWHTLKASYGDALAVEMESAGVFRALVAHPNIERLSVRGISDLVVGKSEADGAGWQPRAASHAAAFAFEVLAKLTLGSGAAAAPAAGTPPAFALPIKMRARGGKRGGRGHGQYWHATFGLEVENASFRPVQLVEVTAEWFSGDDRFQGRLALSGGDVGGARALRDLPHLIPSRGGCVLAFALEPADLKAAGLRPDEYDAMTREKWSRTDLPSECLVFMRCQLTFVTEDGGRFRRDYDLRRALPPRD
jgi:nucleoside phosphorylase